MITFMDSREKIKGVDKCLDAQLWHACAGGMVQMPPVSSKVFYFPQGHAEHASGPVDFRSCPRVPSFMLCRVSAVRFMADPETDEVYAKIGLIPVQNSETDHDHGIGGTEAQEKPVSFAKTLTQSDANNGGGFSVPRYCAETIFPRLDYTADPPVQTILAKDVHGEIWKFRHIYRGTPRRHLLTTGWSTFVNHKKLVAGDSIVFLRTENGDLCVGIRRAKRGIGAGHESSSGWNPNSLGPYGSLSVFLRNDENKLSNVSAMGKGKVRPESVLEAITLAANGKPFEVVYYPRASSPEFCVKASLVRSAWQTRWCSGMRFKMPFETEDSSRISWFMGTVSSVQVVDPLHWPDSPWRLLQVTWDEPDLLQNVKRVSPWLVELVSSMPAIHLSPFSPPRKKMRLPDFPLDTQFPTPHFSGNFLGSGGPFGNTPAGMQGARHAHYGLSLSDIHLSQLHPSMFSIGKPSPAAQILSTSENDNDNNNENVSCLLTMASSTQSPKKPETPRFVLFGQPILTEQQISICCSGDNSSSEGNAEKMTIFSDPSSCEGLQESDSNLETGHCKVFMESEDVGRTLDLLVLGSYEALYKKLADMFGIESSEVPSHVLYRDLAGSVKHVGDEPFSDFAKTARRLTVLMDSSSNNVGM